MTRWESCMCACSRALIDARATDFAHRPFLPTYSFPFSCRLRLRPNTHTYQRICCSSKIPTASRGTAIPRLTTTPSWVTNSATTGRSECRRRGSPRRTSFIYSPWTSWGVSQTRTASRTTRSSSMRRSQHHSLHLNSPAKNPCHCCLREVASINVSKEQGES